FLKWVQDEGIEATYEMISVEETLTMPLLDGEVELRGKFDGRWRRKSDGTRLVVDYKTTAETFEQFSSLLHLNEQVKTYMLLDAYQNTENDRADGALFILLKKNKQTAAAKGPFYAEVEIL